MTRAIVFSSSLCVFFTSCPVPPPSLLQALLSPLLPQASLCLLLPSSSLFLSCQKQIYSACDACRAEECKWACVCVCVWGCRVSGEGRCVCTIRDKIMAPQGLVWPCTRSIKRQLQVPRSTLMSIFWGLIFHTEHTYTHTHTLDLPASLYSLLWQQIYRPCMLLNRSLTHKWDIAARQVEEKESDELTDPRQVMAQPWYFWEHQPLM